MSRHNRGFWALAVSSLWIAAGCHPTQPFYFFEDGDLSHYLDVATEIEEPDFEEPPLDEVLGSHAPLTLGNPEDYEFWDLTLEETIRITLENSSVMRELGARVASAAPDTISRNIIDNRIKTVYDPAVVESGAGGVIGSQLSGTGVEAALSEFDAQLTTSMFWERNDRPQNFLPGGVVSAFFTPVFQQDLGRFTAQVSKTATTGGTFAFRNNTIYDANNNPSRALYSDFTTNFEAEVTQPLLQGAGSQYNRIAGPLGFNGFAGGFNSIDGIMIARVRVDQTLADFEVGVQDLVKSVEDTYWNLYFAYRNLQTRKVGRDSALQTWKRVNALYQVGSVGGEAEKEAQARSQYYFFRSEVETALTEVFRAESRLRYAMGLPVADGRLVRPIDEPTTARVRFEWCQVHAESIHRRVEVRKQKWSVKQRQLELVAARNHLLPRLDAVARYRWQGLGDNLIDPNRSGVTPIAPGSTAFESLTGGDFQDWALGLQFSLPIGFRRQLAQVRHHELLLARDRALLRDLQLEISHQLGDALRDVEQHYQTSQTNFNRLVASQKEVDAVQAAYEADTVTLDLLLDAQRRRADAETAYYQSLVDYNRAISLVHDRKGSLLEYDGVFLAEGPWPAKAYFDALREARKRDASTAINYGFTRPRVISRGTHPQYQDPHGYPVETLEPTEAGAEPVAAPEASPPPEPPAENELPAPTAARPRQVSRAAGPRRSTERVQFASGPEAEWADFEKPAAGTTKFATPPRPRKKITLRRTGTTASRRTGDPFESGQ